MGLLGRQSFGENRPFWRCIRSIGIGFSANITNRSSIVRYALFDAGVGVDVDIGEGGALPRNLGTGLGRRDGFGDAGFDTIAAQDICVFGVADKVRSAGLGISVDGVAGGVGGA